MCVCECTRVCVFGGGRMDGLGIRGRCSGM